tara:strand:+ start:3165 stop:4280 length:1116 start_codon:yes stop_codon:yes gene_type:complete
LEFGWSRGDILFSTALLTMSQALVTPIVGRIIDRFGSKEVLMPSILLFGLLLAAIPLFISEIWHIYIIYLMMGSLACGSTAIPYLRIVGSWFNKNRGLAFGIAMSGGGLGFAYMPPLLQYMIDNHGWRSGFYVLAAIIIFIAFPLIAIVVRNTPSQMGLLPDGEVQKADDKIIPQEKAPKITLSELLQEKLIWHLYAIFVLLTFCLYGLMANFAPLLIDRGMETGSAALVVSTLGITVICSRVGIGYLLDKFFAPKVAMVCVIFSAIGIALLAAGAIGMAAFVAALFIGVSIGAEFDLLAYLTSRYFGMKSFGLIYGILFTGFLLGVSAGPFVFGAVFDHFGSYFIILTISSLLLIVIAGLMALLPKYKNI